jgi:hypothetical protein
MARCLHGETNPAHSIFCKKHYNMLNIISILPGACRNNALRTVLCVLFSTAAFGQIAGSGPSPVYSNRALGFSYVIPRWLLDQTKKGQAEIRERAAEKNSHSTLELLLALSSGSDNKAPNWCSVTVETYPRQALSDMDDAAAEAKMTGWILGLDQPVSPTQKHMVSGQNFAISVIGMRSVGATKGRGAAVWTTIRKGKLLSFAFAANSPQNLNSLAQTMKSLQFF